MNKVLNICFRVDGYPAIGMGHVYRCHALATEFLQNGHKVSFLMHVQTKPFVYKLDKRIKKIFTTNRQESNNLGRYDIVFMDGYKYSYAYEKKIRKSLDGRLAVIDDFPARKHCCDLYVNQSPISKKSFASSLPKKARLLLGPSYALLDPSLSKPSAKKRISSGTVEKILVNFGSSGPSTLYEKVAKALKKASFVGEVDFVLGHTEVKNKPVGSYVSRYHGFVDLLQLTQKADLVIGANGLSALERCILKKPSISVSMSKDQVPNATLLSKQKATLYLGPYYKQTISSFAAPIRKILRNKTLVVSLSKNASQCVDTNGSKRVAKEVYELMKRPQV